MLIGYARTSTVEQRAGLDAQVAELRGSGVEELFVEQVSSIQRREEFKKALTQSARATPLSSPNWIGWLDPSLTLSGSLGRWRRNRLRFVSWP